MVYAGRDDFTVIDGNMSTEAVNEVIEENDHIIMMGHGTPQGLLSVGQFNKKPIKKYTPPAKAGKTNKAKVQEGEDLFEDDDEFWEGYNYAGVQVGAATKPKQTKHIYTGYTTGHIINDDTAKLLEGKQLTSIWCNADQYIEWNGLNGFYTGMFISETAEAKIIGLENTDQWQVDESNYAFVTAMRKHIDDEPQAMFEAVRKEYGEIIDHNAVAKYNYRRLYVA